MHVVNILQNDVNLLRLMYFSLTEKELQCYTFIQHVSLIKHGLYFINTSKYKFLHLKLVVTFLCNRIGVKAATHISDGKTVVVNLVIKYGGSRYFQCYKVT